jgi:hypothetical protein
MQLNKIDDPRSNLQKARRRQLVEFAHAKGMTEISEQMDADLIRERLMQRGFSQIPLRTYSLGHAGRHEVPPIGPKAPPQASPPGLSADELQQFREWQQQRQQAPAPAGDIDKMPIGDLRKACKAKKIPMVRTDNMASLKEKLKAHG